MSSRSKNSVMVSVDRDTANASRRRNTLPEHSAQSEATEPSRKTKEGAVIHWKPAAVDNTGTGRGNREAVKRCVELKLSLKERLDK